MTVYTFPSIAPATTDSEIVPNIKTFTSPLTKFTVASSRPGTKWSIKMFFETLYGPERAVMQAYLALMSGKVHRALIYDHAYHEARGALGGTPLIDGPISAGASTAPIKGMTADVTGIFKAGDQISFLNTNGFYELKMVMLDADTNGLGEVNVIVSPETHQIIDDGATVVTTNPAGTFMLASPTAKWSNRPDGDGSNNRNPNQSNFSPDWIEDMQ